MSMLPLAKSENILTQAVDNELLIYNLENHRAVCLNETSAMVWRECNGAQSIAQISDIMSKRLNALIGEDFVWLALDELQKNGLLENSEKMTVHTGMSRRNLAKKVGLMSMVALPVVSSIVAPRSAMAQSVACPQFLSIINVPVGEVCCPDLAPVFNGQDSICCAVGAAGTLSPGSTFCNETTGTCSSLGSRCCSNSASTTPLSINCANLGFLETCVCNPLGA